VVNLSFTKVARAGCKCKFAAPFLASKQLESNIDHPFLELFQYVCIHLN
jgi:hypothetical protein